MLTPNEQKIVLSTLTSRRAWLKKTLEEGKIDEDARAEQTNSLKLLDSAMQKIGNIPTKPASPAPSPSTNSPRKKITLETARILIADDNQDSSDMLLGLLQDIGIKVVDVANDGIEAFDKIKSAKEPYDIILCDWDMPGLAGIEVHQKAKASNTLKDAHFVMVTAVTEAAKIREAIQQGVNDYVAKPVDGKILEGKIKAAIAAKMKET